MSYTKELVMEIQEMLEEGYSPGTIARVLEISVETVLQIADQSPEPYSPYETCNS